jgi:tRNA threonylcarbamoyladenosine biosynthesis protein TsaE
VATILLPSRRDTVRLGSRIGEALRRGDLVLLHGDLGAGKTFLARAIARSLGVGESAFVGSPTFALVHEYETKKGELLHADFFRIREGKSSLVEEIARLGLRERRAAGAIMVVEWGEQAEEALGGESELIVILNREGANARRATISGARAQEVL